jgi:hypothetical protein
LTLARTPWLAGSAMTNRELKAEGGRFGLSGLGVSMVVNSSPAGLFSRSLPTLITHIENESEPRLEPFIFSAVLASAAWIEAAANEIFEKCVLGAESNIAPLDRAKVDALGKLWREQSREGEQLRRKNPMEKWKFLLKWFAGLSTDKREKRAENARLLIELRNYIAHAKPWHMPPNEDQLKFEQQITGRFELNDGNRVFFPYRIFSRGCAKWASETASSYIRYELDRLGLTASMLGV